MSSACCIIIVISLLTLLGLSGLLGAVRRRMIFSFALVAHLALPTGFVKRFFLLSIGTATSLSKRCSFRVSRFDHRSLAALIQQMECLLTGFGMMVFASCEITLHIHLELRMLGPTLMQEET